MRRYAVVRVAAAGKHQRASSTGVKSPIGVVGKAVNVKSERIQVGGNVLVRGNVKPWLAAKEFSDFQQPFKHFNWAEILCRIPKAGQSRFSFPLFHVRRNCLGGFLIY